MEIKRLLASSLAVLFSLSCSNVYGVKKFRNLKSTPKNRLCDLCGTLYNKNKKEGTGIGALVERQMHAGCRYRCTANLCGECFDNYCKMFVGDIFLVSDSSNKCPLCYTYCKPSRSDRHDLVNDVYETFNSLAVPDKIKRLYYRLIQKHYVAMSKKGEQPKVNMAQRLHDDNPNYFEALVNPNTASVDNNTFTRTYVINRAVGENKLGTCCVCGADDVVLVKFCCGNDHSDGVCTECLPDLAVVKNDEGRRVILCPMCREEMEAKVLGDGFYGIDEDEEVEEEDAEEEEI